MSYQPHYPTFVQSVSDYLDRNPYWSMPSATWDAFLICFNHPSARRDLTALHEQQMTVEDRKRMIKEHPLPDVPKSMIIYAIGYSPELYAPIKLTGHIKKICENYLSKYLI